MITTRRSLESGLLPAVIALCAIAVGIVAAVAPMLMCAVAAAFLLIAVMWKRPRTALLIWLITIATIPVWVGVSISAYLPLHALVALCAIGTIAVSVGFRPSIFDFYFGAFLILTLGAVVLLGSNQALWVEFAVQWGVPYLLARVVISKTDIAFATNAVAVVMAFVGAFAVLEYLLAWHPFTGWMVDSVEYQTWMEIQTRGGVDRSEWAFGHSIALGGALALSIPFVLSSTFGRWIRAAMLSAVFAGVFVTASRAALIAALFTAALYGAAYFVAPPVRLAIAVIVGSVLVVLPEQFSTFVFGVTSEARGSAAYRGDLYELLMPEMAAVGKSDLVTFTSTGAHVGRFQSIDSSVLYIGMNFGWFVVGMLLVPLGFIVWRLAKGVATIAEIALLGQLPLLVTVALITQYQSLLFFVAGFAVQLVYANKSFRNQPVERTTS